MIAHLLLLATLVVAGAGAPLCDTSAATRARWADDASASLEGDGYSVARGALRYAPVGTISDPAGTYGALVFDDAAAAYPSRDFCACLDGNASVAAACARLVAPMFSGQGIEAACHGTYVLRPRDAVVIVGCTPPPAAYFGLQTNVFARFSFDASANATGAWFPQVSPYDTVNSRTINTTRGSAATRASAAYAFVSTADRGTARAVAAALVAAGVPDGAINVDALTSDDVRLWEGGDWRAELPDTLQLVLRVNVDASQRAAIDGFVAASQVGAQRALLVRAPDDAPAPSPLPAAAWRARVATASESAAVGTLGDAADATAAVVNRTAAARGYALSFFGNMAPQMDFGYSQSAPDDVEECCLRWPHPTYVWSTSTHYSTRDCLYEALGQMTLANSSVVFSGDARAVSLDAIGAPPELKQFSQLSCDANGTLFVASMCPDAACGSCGYQGAMPADSCTPSGGGSYRFECAADGSGPVQILYADGACGDEVFRNANFSSCNEYSSLVPGDAMWAGSYLKATSIVVVVGAMSNRLNSSTFHDVYFPVWANYNEPEAQLDFTEEELEGSGLAWAPEGAAPAQEDIFVAQFGRACLDAPDGTPPRGTCYEISEAQMGSPGGFSFFVRHYLDPQTSTGPSKDALPPHRVLIFDKLP